MLIIKIIKIKCSNPSRILNEHASILVYKFRPERTGFNMYAEYTQPQLTFLALVPCFCESVYEETLLQRQPHLETKTTLNVFIFFREFLRSKVSILLPDYIPLREN